MPDLHQQPTKEELEKDLENIDKDLENMEKEGLDKETDENPEPKDKDKKEKKEDLKEKEEDDSDDEDESEDDESEDDDEGDDKEDKDKKTETKKEEDKDDKKKEPDYKEKFKQSARESQVLHSKNKKLQEVIEQASNLPEPTEADLAKEYSDWESMSDFEKKMAKETLANKNYRNFIAEGTKGFKDIDAWVAKVDEFTKDPGVLANTPELEGKMEDFKTFALKESRRGLDFEDLVSAFLYEESKNKPKPKKGKMFPNGDANKNKTQQKNSGKMTASEARSLRETNYNKWVELLKAGKIEDDEDL